MATFTEPLCAELVTIGAADADYWDIADPRAKVATTAINICNQCKSRPECYRYAVRTRAWGIWGGVVWRDGERL